MGKQSIEARKQYLKEYREANKEKLKEYYKEYREANKEYYKEYREANKDYNKEYYKQNKETIVKQNKEYREANKDTIKIKAKEYRERDKEKNKEYNDEYRKANKDKINEQRKEYRKANKDKINEARKQRELTDPVFKLRVLIAKNIKKTFRKRSYENPNKTKEILGCSFEEFKIYIESKFEPWMTWENRGLYNGQPNYGWDIDHIIPMATAETIEDVIRLNHYTNLQPLCSYINRYVKKDSI
jgi:hypothetical protein